MKKNNAIEYNILLIGESREDKFQFLNKISTENYEKME